MNEKALQRAAAYLKDWLRFRYEREDIPGFVVAIGYKGKVIFNEAYGYANLETKEKLTPKHLFHIASHSKTFTATAIMLLQEQGKLRIDDRACEYLPLLAEHKDKRWQNVTLRQLLSHGAGVIRDGEEQGYWSLQRPFPDKDRFLKDIMSSRLVIDNNLKMKYSNYGYTLLGLVVEAVAGMPYNEYVSLNIVEELNLKNTYPDFETRLEDKFATGYSRKDIGKRLPIAHINTGAMSAATGFCSNSDDLIKYFSAHIVGSKKLLNDESKKEMQRLQWRAENTGDDDEEYGLGIEIERINGRRFFGHGGGFPGHNTMSLCDPKNELVVVVLNNAIMSGPLTIAKNVVKAIDFFQENEISKLEKYEGRYIGLWSLIDVIASGDKLKIVYPNQWWAFDHTNELIKKSSNKFTISETSSFDSIGEEVIFEMRRGRVKSVLYAGEKIIPEKDYLSEIGKLTRIG